ncbi:hypothetical protein AK812_SmicGene16530 [Symbiodinium microadriaticum]|uniref:Uncharacterized protein n=1 Tax=Symbiodinium microadriaticum TaxID=2951 RepID=A0A1Q9E049_SYMMI|nr:hypothetical protein AK812_SmicGene16530 [Symbiodinium microadriaticum]
MGIRRGETIDSFASMLDKSEALVWMADAQQAATARKELNLKKLGGRYVELLPPGASEVSTALAMSKIGFVYVPCTTDQVGLPMTVVCIQATGGLPVVAVGAAGSQQSSCCETQWPARSCDSTSASSFASWAGAEDD